MQPASVLKCDNVFSYLLTTDLNIKNKLATFLRGRPKNYFHNARYKKKLWDGWEYFFDVKSGKFMTGLLPEVQLACDKFGFEYTFVDLREGNTEFLYKNVDDQFLNMWLPEGTDPLTLHDFQPDLANQVFKYKRGIVKAPTGAGKTFIMISILKALPPKTPVLFLTESASLVHQNYLDMKKWGVEDLGRWYDKYKEPNFVMCATIHQATFESLAKLLPKFRVLMVDEVHDGVSKVPIKAYKKMKQCYIRVGFSATPFRYNKKQIDKVHKYTVKGHFGPEFLTSTTKSGHLTTKDLQDRGILSASDCNFYVIDRPDLAYEPYQDAIKLGIEQNIYFHQVVTRLARSRPGRTLVIVERIEQGEYLKQLMPEAHWIYGDKTIAEREPVLEDLRSKDKCIAIAMRHIITAGINVKIHDLINAAGGDAAHNLIQQMGRGLRLAGDKTILNYHDFLFLINDYLRKHSEWRMQVLRNEGHTVTLREKMDF